MYELECYENNKEWRSSFWKDYDTETKEQYPESNPNFVIFNRGFLKRLRPEKCNVKFLYNKYIELRDKYVAANDSLSAMVRDLLKDADTVIISNTMNKNAMLYIISKRDENICGMRASWSLSFERAEGISSWHENPHLVSDKAREYSRLYKREYTLRIVSRDLMSKICNLMKYKIEKAGVADIGLFYEELDGKKLMFMASGNGRD